MRYRPEEEESEWRQKCPIRRLEIDLRTRKVFDDEVQKSMAEEAERVVEEAVVAAERGKWPEGVEALDHVFGTAHGDHHGGL